MSLKPIGFVYFFRCGWLCKVGFSTEPKARFGEISPPSPAPLEFVGCIKTPMHHLHEREFHKQNKDHAVMGEWYVWDGPIADFVKNGITKGQIA